jgi:AcrR family transcriptional regulator
MRSRLLDAASALFKERGLAGASIADIAAAADAFPSQITYYFRTKEALFVEAACRDVLYAARSAEEAARQAHTPHDYTLALVKAVTRTDAVVFFVEAMMLTRRRQDLAPLIERTVERLHNEGVRAYAAEMEVHGWRSRAEPAVAARRFWALAIGVTLEGYAVGRSAEQLEAEMLRLLEPQADAQARDGRLRLVATAVEQGEPESPKRERRS